VDNPDLALKPGMTATVAIEVAHKDDVLKVPNSALRFVPDWPAERLKDIRNNLHGNQALVWLPEGEQLTPIKVATGITGERETEIISDQLKAGTTIVVPATRQQASRSRRFGLSLF